MIRIGTRDSRLAVWQAGQVLALLQRDGFDAELKYIKSEGDIDLVTPLYEIGVQGIFTRTLDIALLSGRIDIAVHSMKDVPTQLPQGIRQAAVLPRGPVSDLLVFKNKEAEKNYNVACVMLDEANPIFENSPMQIATSSIRRKSQWWNRFPNHGIHNIRGNVITRLKKLQDEPWDAVIFAQAGLERIGMRPETSIELDWMLPAPAQGAIMIVCRSNDERVLRACRLLDDADTALCTKIERDFLRALLGGCSTPISALATIHNNEVGFKGNIFSLDGKEKIEVEKKMAVSDAVNLGISAAVELLENGGQLIADAIRNAK